MKNTQEAAPFFNLLTQCTRMPGSTTDYRQLTQLAGTITNWDNLSTLAESHSLGPLLYTHLQAAGVSIPPTQKLELQGLYLRHRHANQIRAEVLSEILNAYQTAGIEAFVLKGAALAHLIYPQPGLRPMRDMDLLVKKSQVRQAQHLLTELGFNALAPAGETLPSKHLAAATRKTKGMLVSVEVHHNLFHHDYQVSTTTDDFTSPPLSFTLPGGVTAYTLGYQDMLHHLCHHISNIAYPFRLIWLADIVGFAEMFVDQIDWPVLKRLYPRILNLLSLFHWMTPLSDRLQQTAGLKIGRPPEGIGQEFAGWPRYALAQQQEKRYARIVSDTLWPSEWWLRLYYGVGTGPSLFWHRWVRHPLHIVGLFLKMYLQK